MDCGSAMHRAIDFGFEQDVDERGAPAVWERLQAHREVVE
jgi:hypothetical protein